jgi:hypothetical protein
MVLAQRVEVTFRSAGIVVNNADVALNRFPEAHGLGGISTGAPGLEDPIPPGRRLLIHGKLALQPVLETFMRTPTGYIFPVVQS